MARPPKTEEVKTEDLVTTATTPEKKVGEQVALANVQLSEKEFAVVKVTFDFDTEEMKKMEILGIYNNKLESKNAYKLATFKEKLV